MDNPRHMTQIGLPRGNRRVFLEDYVVSYMKQHKREGVTKVALYGNARTEEGATKYFVYGVACFEEQNEDNYEKVRSKYFSSYRYLGWGELSNELPDGFYIEDENGTSYIEGYYCFYDNNDAMLNLMVEEREQIHEKKEVLIQEPMPERMSAREYRKATSHTPKQPINKLKLSVVITFLIMCAVSVREFLSEQEHEDNATKVVTESNLIDALQQENASENKEKITDNNKATDVSENEGVSEREPVVFEETELVEAISTSAEVTATDNPPDQYHIVKRGDNLINISIQYYGNKNQVHAICDANDIVHPDEIKIGQKLRLP